MSETDEDSDWLMAVSSGNAVSSGTAVKKMVKCKMIVEGQEVTFQVDTGASVNMIPGKYARNVEPCSGTLRMWNQSIHKPAGSCRLKCGES